MPRVLVLNPNSNETVTGGMRTALADFDRHPTLHIECRTLTRGPFGIESDADIEAVLPLLVEEVRSRSDADAYVIACYSDPGLAECRALTQRPVLGMQQSALATAVALDGTFGVLALGEASIARHLGKIEALGLTHRLAGERPLHVSVDEAANDPATEGKILDAGKRLVEEDGAATLILGCAGMARHRATAERELGVPVIDPVQAAVAIAVGLVLGTSIQQPASRTLGLTSKP